jgi:hypothetical protein
MSDIKNKLIKIAYEHPEVRGDLLPIILKFGTYDYHSDPGYQALSKLDNILAIELRKTKRVDPRDHRAIETQLAELRTKVFTPEFKNQFRKFEESIKSFNDSSLNSIFETFKYTLTSGDKIQDFYTVQDEMLRKYMEFLKHQDLAKSQSNHRTALD